MEKHTIDGPVISFISSDKKARDRAGKIRYTAAAIPQRDGKTIIIVKCDFGDTPEVYAKMIATDYKKIGNLRMRYLNHNPNGVTVTLTNNSN